MTESIAFELDRKRNRLVFRRDLATSAERAFDAWTVPALITRWWDPEGRPLAGCDVDLRVGGAFRFVNAGGGAHGFAGTYTEIDRPHRLAFGAQGASGVVTFEEAGGTTRMTVEITCGSEEHLEQFVRMGIADGTARTLDNLSAFLRERAA